MTRNAYEHQVRPLHNVNISHDIWLAMLEWLASYQAEMGRAVSMQEAVDTIMSAGLDNIETRSH